MDAAKDVNDVNSGYLKDSFDEGVQRKKSRMILGFCLLSSVDGGAVSWDRTKGTISVQRLRGGGGGAGLSLKKAGDEGETLFPSSDGSGFLIPSGLKTV